MRGTKKSLWLSLLLSVVIGLAQCGFLVYRNLGGYGFADTSNQYTKALYSMNLSAYWPMLRFLIALLFVHVVFGFIVYFAARFFLVKFRKLNWLAASLLAFALFYGSILIVNSYFYPMSFFAFSYFSTAEEGVFNAIAFFSVIAVLGCLLAFSLFGLLDGVKHKKTVGIIVATLFISAILFCYLPSFILTHSERDRLGYHNSRPNIIVFMYCSMRADLFLQAPNFSKFAKESIWLSDAYVPVTRSGPSTYALLSGLYPPDSGYFFNLSESNPKVKFKNLLPQILAKNGYQTILLTNINLFRRTDEKMNWGFQVIDATPHNVFAFFIPKISDIPLVNVLTNFSFSKWLFNYSYNNVEDVVHYKFSHFSSRLQYLLKNKLERKPIFMLINDEAMHFPYAVPGEKNQLSLNSYLRIYYLSSLMFSEYLQMLEKYNLLENTVVIVTADHGESFGSYFPADGPFVFHSHGNTAISKGEFKVPLAFHFFNNDKKLQTKRIIHGNVSTLDIMPTLLDLLKLPVPQVDGVSLLPVLKGEAPVNQDRILYRQAELTFSVEAGATAEEQIKALAKTKLNTYQVNRLGEVSIKVSAADKAKLQIEYSAFLKNILLVYSPKGYLLINTDTRKFLAIPAQGLEIQWGALNEKNLSELGTSSAELARLYVALKSYVIKAHIPFINNKNQP